MDAIEILTALTTPVGMDDPYPYYAKLHELGEAVPVAGMVLVHGFDAINAVMRDPGFSKADTISFDKDLPSWREHPSLSSCMEWMLNLNPPEHTRIRSVVGKAFTHRRVAALEPAIAQMTDQSIAVMADKGADGSILDFIDDFATLLPVIVICELLGIPEADREAFRPLARDLATLLDLTDIVSLDAADAATAKLADYFTELTAERRMNPRNDLISALVNVSDSDNEKLSKSELLSNLSVLLLAGFATTSNLLANGLQILLENLSAREALSNGSIPVAAFVEEVLRYESPIQMGSRVGYDKVVGGVPVSAGDEVITLIAAGNRDPRRFRDPNTFDPKRPDAGSISFGGGAHFCIGAALARLEGVVAFPRLLARFPALASAGAPTRSVGYVLRGFETLPVTVF